MEGDHVTEKNDITGNDLRISTRNALSPPRSGKTEKARPSILGNTFILSWWIMDVSNVNIGSRTKFILSTSGRASSMKRYNIMLQSLLQQDIAYVPISSGTPENMIDPERYAFALKGMNCLGGAISKDIKHSIIPHLDFVDEAAAHIQSVNTVIVRDSKLFGYNTDALGFRCAIQPAIETPESVVESAICYGYGGVTSVVIAVLLSLGIKRVFICGRRLDEAAKRASEFGVDVWTPDVRAQLFVNATPVTDKPLDDAAHFLEALQGCGIAFDHEMPGKYLQQYCEQHGVRHISGYAMYYRQMYEQWSLFLEGIAEKEEIPNLIANANKILESTQSEV